MVERDALEDLEVRVIKSVPVQALKEEIMAHIDAQVCTGSYGPASMLEFLFVGIDRDVGSGKVL